MDLESEETKWLKRHFQETPSEGPLAKRVKFDSVRQGLLSRFPDKALNHQQIARIIKNSFPSSVSKRLGSDRSTHIIGIEEREECENDLVEENAALRQRIDELEQAVNLMEQQHPITVTTLLEEFNRVTSPVNSIYHGPDTSSHFQQFSLESLQAECRKHAPTALQLCQAIADVDRHESKSDIHRAQARVMMCMCSLVKSRSTRVQGVQLLNTMMLIARSTSRQVTNPAHMICIHV